MSSTLYFWVAKLVGSAPACYCSSVGSNPDVSQKYKMGGIMWAMDRTSAKPQVNLSLFCAVILCNSSHWTQKNVFKFKDDFYNRRCPTSCRRCIPPRAPRAWTQCVWSWACCLCPGWSDRRSERSSGWGRWCKRSKKKVSKLTLQRRHSEASFSYRSREPVDAQLVHEVGEALARLHLTKSCKSHKNHKGLDGIRWLIHKTKVELRISKEVKVIHYSCINRKWVIRGPSAKLDKSI